jgi:hypothetical protein
MLSPKKGLCPRHQSVHFSEPTDNQTEENGSASPAMISEQLIGCLARSIERWRQKGTETRGSYFTNSRRKTLFGRAMLLGKATNIRR